MGDYADKLSERLKHTQINQGYCLICGTYGKLTADHVPPKGSITVTTIEQVHLTELMGVDAIPVKGIKSPGGSKFKTICGHCNQLHLGANDEEIKRVYKQLTKLISHHFTHANNPFNQVSTQFNATKFCRAMIGHILSATTVIECKNKPIETPYFTPLQRFVLGDDSAINETHDIYCWFYPHRHHLSAKMFTFRNRGNLCTISVLSFYPLAFSITEKGKGIYPSGARKIEQTDDRLYVDLSSGHFPYSGFPFVGLSGDQMMALNNAQAIVSYPIKS